MPKTSGNSNGNGKNGEYLREVGGYVEVRLKIGKGHVSSTGKSTVVCSTGGFTVVEDSVLRANITVIRK